MQDLRNALYAHLQRMPLRFFTETRTGEIQSRLSNDVGGVQSVVTDTAQLGVQQPHRGRSPRSSRCPGSSWQLTLCRSRCCRSSCGSPIAWARSGEASARETQKSLADVTAITEETLSVSGILLSKTFGQQDASASAATGWRTRSWRALSIRQSMVGRWFFMIVGTIFSIMPAFVYWLAGWLAIQGDPTAPTIGDIVAFTTLQSRLFFPLGQLLNVQVEV